MENEEERTFEDKISEIKKVVMEKKIIINRVPLPTKRKFEEFAENEFDNDYGFAFKFLVDTVLGNPITSDEYKEVHTKIDILTEQLLKSNVEIARLKQEKEDNNTITTIGKRMIKKGGTRNE